jgi:hypothetical protein
VFGEIQDSKLPPGLGITKLYDFPLGIAAKLRRGQALGGGRPLSMNLPGLSGSRVIRLRGS